MVRDSRLDAAALAWMCFVRRLIAVRWRSTPRCARLGIRRHPAVRPDWWTEAPVAHAARAGSCSCRQHRSGSCSRCSATARSSRLALRLALGGGVVGDRIAGAARRGGAPSTSPVADRLCTSSDSGAEAKIVAALAIDDHRRARARGRRRSRGDSTSPGARPIRARRRRKRTSGGRRAQLRPVISALTSQRRAAAASSSAAFEGFTTLHL